MRDLRAISVSLLVSLVQVGLVGSAAALTNGAAPIANDSRYDAVGALAVTWRLGLAHGYPDDADHAWFCAATLTSSTTILTATHCVNSYGTSAPYAVRFRRQTDGSLGTVAAGVASFFHAYVASWELSGPFARGTLTEPVEHVAPIPETYGVNVDDPIIQAGWGRQGPAFGQGLATELRLCPNHVFEIVSDWAWYGQPYVGPAQGQYVNTCGANSWDSGGPLLVFSTSGRGDAGGPEPTIFPSVVGVVADEYAGPLLSPPPGLVKPTSAAKRRAPCGARVRVR